MHGCIIPGHYLQADVLRSDRELADSNGSSISLMAFEMKHIIWVQQVWRATKKTFPHSLKTPRFTMQVLRAEAAVAANRWNSETVEDEIRCAEIPPNPRAAHAGCAVGRRIMYFGGWGAADARGEFLVIDLEDDVERERR